MSTRDEQCALVALYYRNLGAQMVAALRQVIDDAERWSAEHPYGAYATDEQLQLARMARDAIATVFTMTDVR